MDEGTGKGLGFVMHNRIAGCEIFRESLLVERLARMTQSLSTFAQALLESKVGGNC